MHISSRCKQDNNRDDETGCEYVYYFERSLLIEVKNEKFIDLDTVSCLISILEKTFSIILISRYRDIIDLTSQVIALYLSFPS
jgi:hypothetical protein